MPKPLKIPGVSETRITEAYFDLHGEPFALLTPAQRQEYRHTVARFVDPGEPVNRTLESDRWLAAELKKLRKEIREYNRKQRAADKL